MPEADAYSVNSDYDVKLSEASIVDGANVNKYYFCQVLQKTGGGFATYFKWGKIGDSSGCGQRRAAGRRFGQFQ